MREKTGKIIHKVKWKKLKKFNLVISVGTIGDCYTNALAKSSNGLDKSEVIEYLKQCWEGKDDVALVTLDCVHWYNTKRLYSKTGYINQPSK